ncbi:zf-AN1 domain containing protein [Asbolus verrucosus]|uniref:Zf-AN1 domain containing protein n=1 Tax=Asbolus verrucosus TaxID=1661398 RepID=A0A482W5H9_ASBVE|nr:zf-AN1 domain containing protein [Asbolus verrucosus]
MSVTVTEKSQVKNKEKKLQEATSSKNLEEVLDKVKKLDNTCSFIKCKNRTNDFAIECKYCQGRFCPTHALPEIHGCGEAVRKDERRKYLHPNIKLTEEKHSQAQTKLNMKLRQMQQERKSKQGFGGKGKKK